MPVNKLLARTWRKTIECIRRRSFYNEITPEQYRGFGFPGADDLGNMFQFYRDFDDVCNSIRDVKFSKELNPELNHLKCGLQKMQNACPLFKELNRTFLFGGVILIMFTALQCKYHFTASCKAGNFLRYQVLL